MSSPFFIGFIVALRDDGRPELHLEQRWLS
jgi:hypothetical protein